MTQDQWLSVLTLSTMWEMTGIRKSAIEWLSSRLDLWSKYALAKKHRVREWLKDAYFELAKRETPLSEIEGTKMGLSESIRMACLREEYLRGKHMSRWGSLSEESIEQAFTAELKAVAE